jgi:hypothetical protein
MIKDRYKDIEEIIKGFKPQQSPTSCWPTAMDDIQREFWKREFSSQFGKNPPLELKDIKRALHQKGPHGQFELKNWLRIINDKIRSSPMFLEERIHQPSLIPIEFEMKSSDVDLDFVEKICANRDTSFPIISVSADWFGYFGLKGWSDPDFEHVVILLYYSKDEDKVTLYDPAEKYYQRSSKKINPPRFISGDNLMAFWDNEHVLPRWISWFRKKDMNLEAWMK